MGDAAEGSSSSSSGRNDPLIGKRLASYEILSLVARGGMGVVYRARHVYIDKTVAIKVLDPALAERAELIERFQIEAQSLARVEHQNVVKVIDILEDQGVHFIVMDFAAGTNLRVRVKQSGPMNPEEILSIARQTADALRAAHREGILHRDIKPENLILNAKGRCKLADFGLAGDLRLIKEGHEGPLNFGTPAYSAPEVMRRMVPDKRSDIFSYGATLYFLATGEPPFGQTGVNAIMLNQKRGAELLEARRPDLPLKLCKLIHDCMSYHPADRPGEFSEVLERIPKRAWTRAVPDTGPTPSEPTEEMNASGATSTIEVEQAGISRTVAAVGVLVAVGAIAFLGFLAYQRFWPTTSAPPQNLYAKANIGPPVQPPPDANRDRVNEAPSNAPVNPFAPEDDGFNNATLDSRSALSRADYAGAYAAWAVFLRAYPQSGRAHEAKERQREVASRVAALREKEFRNAKEASDRALREKRIADALAIWARFPAELQIPLFRGEEIDILQRIVTQTQRIEAAEATDLAALFENADRLRQNWKKANEPARLASRIVRLRVAGNLLGERKLLEGFLAGRTEQARQKVEARLGTLRQQLESAHQNAQRPVETWRNYNGPERAKHAREILGVIDGLQNDLRNRRWVAAGQGLQSLGKRIEKARKELAEKVDHAPTRKRIGEDAVLRAEIARYRAHVTRAAVAESVIQSILRDLKLSHKQREFKYHTGLGPDGKRLATLLRVHGRVTRVKDVFEVEDRDGKKHSIAVDMLAVETVRQLYRSTKNVEQRIKLVTWLYALGRVDDAESEVTRALRLPSIHAELAAKLNEMEEFGRIGGRAVRRLSYFVAREGAVSAGTFLQTWGSGSTEARLLKAARGIESGSTEAAAAYVELVRNAVDSELVGLETLATALTLARGVTIDDLKTWQSLEPDNPEPLAALAAEYKRLNEPTRSRLAAQEALLLDPSLESAWRILRKDEG